MKVLEGSSAEWLSKVVVALNRGDIAAFTRISREKGEMNRISREKGEMNKEVGLSVLIC
jgi:hypothetical protein